MLSGLRFCTNPPIGQAPFPVVLNLVQDPCHLRDGPAALAGPPLDEVEMDTLMPRIGLGERLVREAGGTPSMDPKSSSG